MLDAQLLASIEAHIDKIRHPVVLRATLDDGERSAELRGVLEAIAGLTDDITLETDGDDARCPSFTVERAGTEVSVAFAGIPLGHEFTSLVLAVLQVGGHPPRIDDDVADAIRGIDADLDLTTYVSLSCQNCPDVVQSLNTMSVLNPRIRHTMVDGALFRAEVEAAGIKAVPTVVHTGGDRAGEVFGQGRMTLEQIVARLDEGAAERAAEEIAAKDDFDVLVVGGGPAGAAAAVYAARKGIRTGLVSERFGGQVLDTMGIENLISVPRTEGPKLATALEAHVREYDVDVMDLQVASGLGTTADGMVEVTLASGASLRSRTVVLATGARWRNLGVPGEDEHRNKGVTYCPHCDGPLFAGKPVAVIGGGNSGIEAAIDLAGLASQVTVLEFADDLIADDVLQRKLASLPNVTVIRSAQTTELVGDGTALAGLRYTDRTTGDEHVLEVEGVFVQIGLLPNTEWLQGAVELSDRGEVVVDDHGRTSVPGVFAAGDCTTVPYKQIVVALGAGATASLAAFDHLIRTDVPATGDEDERGPAAA